jgi:hypothetical protein
MHARVGHQVGSHAAVTLHEPDQAGLRRVEALHQAAHHRAAREWHDLRRLDDDRVAGDERRHGEQHDLLDGVVPRRADGDDAVRVAVDHRTAVDFRLVRLPHQLAVLVLVCVVVDLLLRFRQRLAHLNRDLAREAGLVHSDLFHCLLD